MYKRLLTVSLVARLILIAAVIFIISIASIVRFRIDAFSLQQQGSPNQSNGPASVVFIIDVSRSVHGRVKLNDKLYLTLLSIFYRMAIK